MARHDDFENDTTAEPELCDCGRCDDCEARDRRPLIDETDEQWLAFINRNVNAILVNGVWCGR